MGRMVDVWFWDSGGLVVAGILVISGILVVAGIPVLSLFSVALCLSELKSC